MTPITINMYLKYILLFILQTFCDNKSHYHWSDTELKATFDKALVVMRAEGTYNELAKNILILMFMANNTEC